MNTYQAKAEPLPEFLARMGHAPVHVRGSDVWYRSPFRPDERTASFKVDRARNIWYDHGRGEGGTIIDLVGSLHETTDIPAILSIISETLLSVQEAKIFLPESKGHTATAPEIAFVREIADRKLETYVRARGISPDLARLYLKEIGYRVGKNDYLALAFGNDSGGYEVRNPYFKGSLGKKDLTIFPREGSQNMAVFEGFFDFLSVLTHYQRDRATGNVMVLNSLALLPRGIEKMHARNISHIHAYLDHDEAGRKGLETLKEVGAWRVTDASHLYAGAKDANEYLA